jgi:hypothetical protein
MFSSKRMVLTGVIASGLYCSYAIVITTLPMIHAAILRERSGAPSLGQFLRYAVVIQAVVAAGTVFSLLLMAASFGSDVSCNERLVVVVFFVTLQALGDGRLVGMTILVLLVLTAIWSVYQGRYLVKSTSTPSRLVTSCILITLSAAILICHAELFLAQNRPQAGERSWASIGQVSCHALFWCNRTSRLRPDEQILPVAAAIDQSYRAVTVLMYRVRHLRQQPWFPLCGFIGPPSIFRHFSEVLRSVSGNAIVSRFASSQNLSHQQHHAIAGDNVVPDVSAGGDVSTIDMETGSGHSTQQNARQPSGLPFIRPWLADSVNPAIQEPPTGGIEMAHIENHSAVRAYSTTFPLREKNLIHVPRLIHVSWRYWGAIPRHTLSPRRARHKCCELEPRRVE